VNPQGISALMADSRTRMLNDPPPARRWVGQLDRTRNVGILDLPDSTLKRFEIPLKPMLGRVAVAPGCHRRVNARDASFFDSDGRSRRGGRRRGRLGAHRRRRNAGDDLNHDKGDSEGSHGGNPTPRPAIGIRESASLAPARWAIPGNTRRIT
jgi:hypothetical protein